MWGVCKLVRVSATGWLCSWWVWLVVVAGWGRGFPVFLLVALCVAGGFDNWLLLWVRFFLVPGTVWLVFLLVGVCGVCCLRTQ